MQYYKVYFIEMFFVGQVSQYHIFSTDLLIRINIYKIIIYPMTYFIPEVCTHFTVIEKMAYIIGSLIAYKTVFLHCMIKFRDIPITGKYS